MVCIYCMVTLWLTDLGCSTISRRGLVSGAVPAPTGGCIVNQLCAKREREAPPWEEGGEGINVPGYLALNPVYMYIHIYMLTVNGYIHVHCTCIVCTLACNTYVYTELTITQ